MIMSEIASRSTPSHLRATRADIFLQPAKHAHVPLTPLHERPYPNKLTAQYQAGRCSVLQIKHERGDPRHARRARPDHLRITYASLALISLQRQSSDIREAGSRRRRCVAAAAAVDPPFGVVAAAAIT